MRSLMLLLITAVVAAAADKAILEPWSVTASANAGRAGKYQASTRYAEYNYYVCVPSTYSGDNPAGIHIYFHGQGGQTSAPNFDRWSKFFLEPFNLIGINMEYTDGDNMRDTDGKVAASQQAIAQVCADYKVIVPRGVVCSFSGGGLPHGLNAVKYGSQRGPRWPFNVSAMYSSNYNQDAALGAPLAWYIGVGTAEWSEVVMGVTAVRCSGDIYRASARGGNPDLFFNVIGGKTHTVLDVDAQTAATLFPLADLAFSPCIYVPDYTGVDLKDLRPAVEQSNALQLGAAGVTLSKILARPTNTDAVNAAGARLQAKLSTRIDAVVAMIKRLAQEDPARGAYYGPLLLAQLKGSDSEKEARAALIAQAKDKAAGKALAAHAEFAKLVPVFFGEGGSSPKPVPEKLIQLKQLATVLGDKSQAGMVAAALISLEKK